MRQTPDARAELGWPAVHALVERWADLPAAAWRALLAAEVLVPPEKTARDPDALERWLIRDLVDTAWAMACRKSPPLRDDWTVQARSALERLAWRVLEPRDARHLGFERFRWPPLRGREQ